VAAPRLLNNPTLLFCFLDEISELGDVNCQHDPPTIEGAEDQKEKELVGLDSFDPVILIKSRRSEDFHGGHP